MTATLCAAIAFAVLYGLQLRRQLQARQSPTALTIVWACGALTGIPTVAALNPVADGGATIALAFWLGVTALIARPFTRKARHHQPTVTVSHVPAEPRPRTPRIGVPTLTPERVRELHDRYTLRRVFGTPGGSLNGKYGTAGAIGQEGEQVIGARISQLAEERKAWAFHDLHALDLDQANLDHAFVTDQRVVLIDSKVWAPGRYRSTPSGEVWRGTERCEHVEAALRFMARQADALRQRFTLHGGRFPVEAMIVVASSGRLDLTDVVAPGVRLVSLNALEEALPRTVTPSVPVTVLDRLEGMTITPATV